MPCIRKKCNGALRQQGFLLPLALFMIMFAGGLALLMNKQAIQLSTLSALDVFAQNSVYAAETGVQLAANKILFPVTTRQQADSRCQLLSINQRFELESLDQCTISITCSCRYESNVLCNAGTIANYDGSAGVAASFYQLQSTAVCGSGAYRARHEVNLSKVFP